MCFIDNSEGHRIWIFRFTGQEAHSTVGREHLNGIVWRQTHLRRLFPGGQKGDPVFAQPQARTSPSLHSRPPRSLFPSTLAQPYTPLGSRPVPCPLSPPSLALGPASPPAHPDSCSTDSPPRRASQGEVNLKGRECVSVSPRRRPGPPIPSCLDSSLRSPSLGQRPYDQASRAPGIFQAPRLSQTRLCAPSNLNPVWVASSPLGEEADPNVVAKFAL